MSFRSAILLMPFVWLPAMLCGQVRVDHAMQLEGPTPQDRQLHGLAGSTSPQAVITAGVEGSGTHRFTTVDSGPVWIVDLPSFTTAPAEGLHLLVRSDGSSNGPLSISVNGFGPYPISRGPSQPVQAEEIPQGSVLSLVFDGAVFQVLNGTTHGKRDCPLSMIQVSDQFCMEQMERDTLEFFDAALACAQQGFRLCSWGEFIVACENGVALGLQQMVGNYEWTNDAANEDNSVRVAGNLNCEQAGVTITTGTPRNFRCCLSR